MEIERTWKTVRRMLRSSSQLNEANTKLKIIEPILSSLGWDMLGDDVLKEYSEPFASGRYRVDYALFIDRKPQIFVEAKPLGTDLTDVYARQVITYSKASDVPWSVLTNGRQFSVYNARWGSAPEDTLFLRFDLDPERDPPKELEMLSRESVSTGNLDRLAQRSHFSLKLRAELLSLLPQLEGKVLNEAKNKIFSKLKDEIRGLSRKQVLDAIRPMIRLDVGGEETTTRLIHKEPVGLAEAGHISVSPIPDLPNGLVVICPAQGRGVDWMKKYNAWGYVRVARTPDYFALYVSNHIRQIRYFARVLKVIDPDDPASPVRSDFEDDSTYRPGKKVIMFVPGSLQEVKSPIPLGQKRRYAMRSLRYTTLEALRNARSVDDIT